jgi:D-amino-acid dehydrogenase
MSTDGAPATVVLGAGLMGVTTAWFLVREGHKVVVVDRRAEAAAETSFANAGLVAPGHALTWASPRAPKILWKSLFRDDQALKLRLKADPAMWAWCWKFWRNCTSEKERANTVRKLGLCVYSQRVMHQVRAAAGIAEGDYDGIRRGLLYVYRDAASFEAAKARMRIISDNGRALETVDPQRIVALEPALESARLKLAGGFYAPDDESGDARKFVLALVASCREMGVEFRLETAIAGLETENGAVTRVVTDKGGIAAGRVVLALGAFSPLLARKYGIKIPVYPVKGYSVTLPIDGRNAVPAIGGVDENGLVAWCRMADKFRLTATAEFAGYDTGHRPADFRVMIETIKALFPDAADYAKPNYWACLRPMTPEGTPIFGRAGRLANLFINTGQGHMGWTMACGSARITADLIAGRQPEIDTTGMIHGAA